MGQLEGRCRMAALDCKERLERKRQKLIRSNRAKEQRVEGGAAASMTTVFLSAGFQLSSHPMHFKYNPFCGESVCVYGVSSHSPKACTSDNWETEFPDG